MIRYITNKSKRMLGLFLAIGLAFSLNSCNNQSVQETKSTIVENQDPLTVIILPESWTRGLVKKVT